MTDELPTKYDPQQCETNWYSRWEEAGYFRARPNPDRKPYCIAIPPPNVTGELHMGHAVQHAIHDNVTRRKRMQGYETLCLPGTDHAGIATQMKVEEKLAREEGKTRYDVGRAGLIERIWEWRETYGDAIYNQLRKLGCSYDWERSRFTLDDGYVAAVLRAFEAFHKHGWIYRGTRMINWCPKCGTVISDLETEERLTQGKLWHIRYPGIAGAPDVTVATTRPETMLGDTGVAVHPTDVRWQAAVGQQVMLPLINRPIPIVADDYADPEMGSGAVKVTPAHDPNDYEVGARHDLAQIVVIGYDGTMTEHAGDWAGQERYECRRQVIAALEAAGMLVQIDDHEHAIPHHDKCGTVIEPLPMEQWFMNMERLADKVRPHLQGTGATDQVSYEPDRYRGYALEWLDNIRDWALSRQIWWGHRIPAWYCVDCSGDGLAPMGGYEKEAALDDGAFRVSVEDGARPIVAAHRPTSCPTCGGDRLVQDPDVLDTWFSSALWPFATLGWPDKTQDLAYFHTTDLMITGRDILYLWVLRMIMTAAEFMEQIPFRQVLIHPTILTKDGKRMSKSLGTGLNPLDLVSLYGADATRYSLLAQCGTTQDVRFDAEIEDNVVQSSVSAEAGRNFCNKLWNAARYVLMNLDGATIAAPVSTDGELADRWILSRLAQTVRTIDTAQESFRFSEVTRALHDFLWRDYCDWYIELVKPRLLSGTPAERAHVQGVLVHVLEQALRLMHPIMPFLTEEIWQQLPLEGERPDSLMIADWPQADGDAIDEGTEADMSFLQDVISAARTIRSELNVPQGKRVQLVLAAGSQLSCQRLQDNCKYVQTLAGAEQIDIGTDLTQPPSSGSAVVGDVEIYVPLEGLIDTAAEGKRLNKEIDKFQGLIANLDKKLANEGFLQKAPPSVIDKERQRQNEYRANVVKLSASLKALAE
jgi:valyl-tRNA synthetase